MALASHREGSSNASHADKASTKIRLASVPASAALWVSMRTKFWTHFEIIVIPLHSSGILATATLGV